MATFLFVLVPFASQWLKGGERLRLMREIERSRNSRVITLIHRQEAIALLGVPLTRYIDIDDSEQILRAIRLTPPDLPIDIVLHTPGGLVLAAEQIAHALIRHKAKVTVFIPHYAMSGGALIALAADEIVMDPNAVLGPVDPQLGQYPAASLVAVLDQKDRNEIDDQTLILADVARKALAQVRATVVEILTTNGVDPAKAEHLAHMLASGVWTHDYPINFEEAQQLGLPVSDAMPASVYRLMDCYPQGGNRRPSVGYVPLPYGPAGPAPSAPQRPTRGER
ncbi:MAG: ATP-dependent Clp protease proteolytic subunit [Dehalococcoidia bacterium]|nr:ATP-dependent Clp protease proteolytic subunit [Dehalococcoidia bacterium]